MYQQLRHLFDKLMTLEVKLYRCMYYTVLLSILYYYFTIVYIQANDSFYAIPCDIRDQILNQTRGNIKKVFFIILLIF